MIKKIRDFYYSSYALNTAINWKQEDDDILSVFKWSDLDQTLNEFLFEGHRFIKKNVLMMKMYIFFDRNRFSQSNHDWILTNL